MEAAEDHDTSADTTTVVHKNTIPNKKAKKGNGNGYHGANTHPTSECKVVKAMVVSTLKSKFPTQDGGKDKSKNKTWSRKAEDAKAATKQEINAHVKKTIKEHLDKLSKKRPKKGGDELNAIDLSKFDYDDLDSLKISSNDEEEEEVISV
jgi:hypothetical protein